MGVVGFEALMRWRHPERGWVPPDVFIPLAEQSDLIFELGSFALDEAVAAAQFVADLRDGPGALRERQPLGPPVPRPGPRGHDRGGARRERPRARASRHRDHRERAAAQRHRDDERHGAHQRLGVGIALDDFGTGYSSLSYLALMHPTIIKIDQSFVSPATESERNDTLLEAIVSLGQKLGLTMSAEGIETPAQLDRLHRLGCEYGQGFLWSPAVPNSEAETMLTRSPFTRQ